MIDSEAKKIITDIYKKDSKYWMKKREELSLSLFRKAAKKVPAYKDFLKSHGIKPDQIKTWQDFQQVPFVDRNNYLNKYSLDKLCWNGDLNKSLIFTSTSASTGKSFYFPREERLDWQASIFHELFLDYSLEKRNGPTLIIIAFGMGVWIGGLITYKAFEIASKRSGHKVSILTPGINKDEIFKAIKELSGHYKNIIICGYPPFVKDLIDQAKENNIDLSGSHVGLTFAAEPFTEKFRSYLVKKLKIKNNFSSMLHVYGSADIGAMAAEFPVGVLIKNLTLGKKKIFEDIFKQNLKTPTLAQFNPEFTSFEEVNGELILTGDNTLPLIRYAIGDRGGVLSFNEMKKKLENYNIDLEKEAINNGIKNFIFKLPFVYIYERKDFSTTLYGINIYPEYIREALLGDIVQQWLTGRFIMSTKFDRNQDQYLEIIMELKKSVRISNSTKQIVLMEVVKHLSERCSEFVELKKYLGKRSYPRVFFLPYEHPDYFKQGIKQKWVKRKI